MNTPVIQSVDKSNLEILLNVAMKNLNDVHTLLKDDPERASAQVRNVQGMLSQATRAWDMQEYSDSDGEDAVEFFEKANRIVGHFEEIEWRA